MIEFRVKIMFRENLFLQRNLEFLENYPCKKIIFELENSESKILGSLWVFFNDEIESWNTLKSIVQDRILRRLLYFYLAKIPQIVSKNSLLGILQRHPLSEYILGCTYGDCCRIPFLVSCHTSETLSVCIYFYCKKIQNCSLAKINTSEIQLF